jgi:uncharacterized protein DUF1488
MALNFPNPTRSYDTKHHCVRFWGYDGAFEVSFMVEQGVFDRISSSATGDESGTLKVFDQYRDKILRAARRVYRGRQVGSYTLISADF